MSVSEQEIKDQIQEMQQDLEDAKAARKASARTKVIGTIIAIIVVSVFVWSLITIVTDIAAELGETDGEQMGFEKVLEESGQKAAFDQFRMQARQILAEQGSSFAERLQNDPEIRAMAVSLWEDTARPALMEAFEQHTPKLASAAEKETEALMEELRTDVAADVREQLAIMVDKQAERLMQEADITEDELDKIVENINTIAELAVEEMITERMAEQKEDWDAINASRAVILEQTPDDIDEYNPVNLLLKLLGHQLQDLEVKGDAMMLETD